MLSPTYEMGGKSQRLSLQHEDWYVWFVAGLYFSGSGTHKECLSGNAVLIQHSLAFPRQVLATLVWTVGFGCAPTVLQ